MQRPIQHIIETHSRKAFEALVPNEWVCRSLTPDYGIDYTIEIFRDGRSTGKSFNVQVKGTEQDISNDRVKVRLKVSTLEYFIKQPLPTLFVVHSTKADTFWAIWINDLFKTRKVKEGQRRLQITLDKSHLIDDKFVREIEDTFCLTIPTKMNISCASNHEFGHEYHTILKKWITHFFGDLLVFDDEHFPIRLLFTYSYRNGYLSIEVDYNVLAAYRLNKMRLTASSDLLMYPSPDYSKVPVELMEPLFLISNLFLERKPYASMKLYELLICDYDGKFKDPSAIWNIGRVALDKGLIADYQNLIRKSIERKKYDDFQFLNMTYMLHRPDVRILDYYGENLLDLISTLENDDDFKGMLCYNLANHYLGRDTKKAIKYYIKAGRLKPWYIQDGFYWWRELGNAFFSEKRFKCAERCYLKVDSLTDEERPLIFAWIGDCLFYQGRFAEAKDWIEKYLKELKEEDLLSYVYLTGVVREILIENKLDGIERNAKEAISLIGKAEKKRNIEKAINLLDQAIQLDPLCAEAWFKLGVLNHKSGKRRDSFFDFLVSSIIDKGNRGAWLNTFFLSSALTKDERFMGLIVGDAIIGEFGKSIIDDIRDTLKHDETLPELEKKSRYRLMLNFFEVVEKYRREKKLTEEIENLIDELLASKDSEEAGSAPDTGNNYIHRNE
jgi:tetratricopeptide (TPR) repeat protein